MPVLTDLTHAQIKRYTKYLYGKVLTRPALLVSDGVQVIYACDVDIGPTDPTGKIDQYKRSLDNLPGQEGWELGDDLIYSTILRNVVIARNNADLIYADVGTPVTLTRGATGQYEITGLAIEQPGTYVLIPVHMGSMTLGPIIDQTIDGRLLTLGEIGELRPFGEIPWGASGIFVGGVLISIV